MIPETATTEELLDLAPSPIQLRERPEGIRVLAPTGEIGFIPEEFLSEALEAGARILGPDEMKEMRKEIFMHHAIFKDKHTFVKPRKRRSIVRSGRQR